MKKQNIVLIGFRGAGKSTFGRALAQVTHLPFADIDEEVEFLIGEPIHSFVEKHGWQVFREVEQRVTHDFCRNFSGILATGGGTIENSKNLQNLKKTGVFVFLNPGFEKVRKYLLTSEKEKKRPRFNPEVSLAEEIDQMWNQRKSIYQATAEYEVNPDFDGEKKTEAKKMAAQLEKILPSPPPQKKVAVFSSSNGTSFEGLLEAQQRGRIPNVEFLLFVTDQPKSGALKKAQKAKIPLIEVREEKKGESREEYDRELMNILRQHNPDAILLAGWMRIFSPLYCDQFGNITYNVHPSLLPQFSGLKGDEVHQKVLEYEERYSGCTIHRVSKDVDAGEIVLQRKVPVDPEDTIDSLRQKVQKQEILGFCELLEKH
ncbi:phosphoribosylglycinamide formyltransferase [Candidatus Gracilibacteria bacterium]|nr:phosphoribosylglycinamide formyltransferase [Candidatus Gracilibacteria bacterium]MCF7819655.1 phosphoribosylglycinamide formyltransferase [Candidatus Gracilibacteria bacterium]